MAAFAKRTFESFGHFRGEMAGLWRERKALRGILSGQLLNEAFRERLMMAVTSVNQCRYCSYAHTRAALKAGVTREELDGLLMRNAEPVPEEERTAVLYAQHWAESRGVPDAEMVELLNTAYSSEKVNAINRTLRFINFCNLSGNTFDALSHTLSFGLLGGGKK